MQCGLGAFGAGSLKSAVLEEAIVGAFERRNKPQWEAVDLETCLKKHGLEGIYPVEVSRMFLVMVAVAHILAQGVAADGSSAETGYQDQGAASCTSVW